MNSKFPSWETENLLRVRRDHALSDVSEDIAAGVAIVVIDSMLVLPDAMLHVPFGAFSNRNGNLDKWDLHRIAPVAFRWLMGDRAVIDPVPPHFPIENDSVFDRAGEAFNSLRDISLILDARELVRRGAASVEVDDARKIIRFLPMNGRTSVAVQDSMDRHARRPSKVTVLDYENHPEALRQITSAEPAMIDGYLRFQNPIALAHPAIRSLDKILLNNEVFSPQQDAWLGEYSLDDARRYMRGLALWSNLLYIEYIGACQSMGTLKLGFSTQFVSIVQFDRVLHRLTGISMDRIKKLRMLFSSCPTDCELDIFVSPLLCGENIIAWSPAVVAASMIERNVFKRLAQEPSMVNSISIAEQAREPLVLAAIAKVLENDGYRVLCDLHRKYEGRQVNIDAIAFTDREPNAVLLVEVKAVRPPDEVGEVLGMEAKCREAQNQLKDRVDAVTSIPPAALKQMFPGIPWKNIDRHHGIVVVSDGVPGELVSNDPFPAITVQMLRDTRYADRRTPTRLLSALKTLTATPLVTETDLEWIDIKVGDVTYSTLGRRVGAASNSPNPCH